MLRIAGQPHRAGSNCNWEVRARRRKVTDCTCCPFGVFRRGLHEYKHVSGADEMRFRFAQTVERNVRGFFSSFSCAYKKRTCFSPFQRKKENIK